MTDFLLVHGAGHGAWVWDQVKGILEESLRRKADLHHNMYSPGTALAVELPGHGSRFGHDNPLHLSFESSVESVLEQIKNAGVTRPVIAVHDLSGLIALEAVRRMEEPPRGLVLVGAVVPDLFHPVTEMLPFPTRALLGLLRFMPGTPPESVKLHKEISSRLLCSDMPYSQASARVLGRLHPIPLLVFDALPDPETLEPTCPVTYAVLKRDWYLLPGAQRRMAASFPNARVVELECGHEAPITHPEEVADLILAYA